MDCERCQSLFSESIDGSLPPRALAALNAHVAACPSCGAELHRMEEALRLLREEPREEPPAALLAATAARVAAAYAAPPVASASRWRALAAAAAILLAALAWIWIARERTWDQRLDTAAEDSRHASSLLADQLDGLRREAAELRSELAATRERETASRAAERLQRSAAETRARQLEEKIAAIEKDSEKEIAGLRAVLESARADALRLAEQLERAREKEAPVREGPAPEKPTIAAPAPPGPAPAGPDRTLADETDPGEERIRDNVVIIDRGSRLELKVRGPRSAVIEDLFAIANNRANPAAADLALNALDNLLSGGGSVPSAGAPAPEQTGFLAWWNRGIDRFAGGLGLRPDDGSAAAPTALDPRRRLRDLEEAWRRELGLKEE